MVPKKKKILLQYANFNIYLHVLHVMYMDLFTHCLSVCMFSNFVDLSTGLDKKPPCFGPIHPTLCLLNQGSNVTATVLRTV